jgi:CcmD family protein
MTNTEWLIVALITVTVTIVGYTVALYARRRKLQARLDDLKGNEH